MREEFGRIEGLRLAFIGDGNNVAHSLLEAAGYLGFTAAIATPKGYEPNAEIVARARENARRSGGAIELVNDPREAARGADVVYTDVWASMGQESEAEKRKEVFRPYQVNAELMACSPKDALVMHCLPAHRGDEISDDVIDSRNSIVYDQAENRLHVQKGLLFFLLGAEA
jgi:ornithine carbamoyltransferase